jgi:hypothetical protein
MPAVRPHPGPPSPLRYEGHGLPLGEGEMRLPLRGQRNYADEPLGKEPGGAGIALTYRDYLFP